PNVDTTIPSIKSFGELEDNYKAVMAHSTWGDRKTLYQYGKSLEGDYCKWCGDCEKSCPMGVQVSELNRALMYAEGYGEYELARSVYSSIPASSNVSQCGNCKTCTVSCPYGINLKDRLERAVVEFGSLRV
ncbi:MAG: 4Fe-4S dicluster domain-containing protein, partial [Patescibacteria group bacterium]|nr:4Fe-4S dicluster domain-containing protein [Patescibacteria group bacterium]